MNDCFAFCQISGNELVGKEKKTLIIEIYSFEQQIEIKIDEKIFSKIIQIRSPMYISKVRVREKQFQVEIDHFH